MASEWGTCWTGQSGHILHGREFSWQRCLGTFKVHIIDASPSLFVQNFKGQWIDPRPHRDPVPLVQNSHHSSRRTSISPHLLWSIPVTHSRGHKDRDEQSQHTLQDLGLLLGIIFCCCFFLKFFFFFFWLHWVSVAACGIFDSPCVKQNLQWRYVNSSLFVVCGSQFSDSAS